MRYSSAAYIRLSFHASRCQIKREGTAGGIHTHDANNSSGAETRHYIDSRLDGHHI